MSYIWLSFQFWDFLLSRVQHNIKSSCSTREFTALAFGCPLESIPYCSLPFYSITMFRKDYHKIIIVLQYRQICVSIVFRVRKQWDYCCHVLSCMVKTIVRNLPFTLTGFSDDGHGSENVTIKVNYFFLKLLQGLFQLASTTTTTAARTSKKKNQQQQQRVNKKNNNFARGAHLLATARSQKRFYEGRKHDDEIGIFLSLSLLEENF